MTRRRTIPRRRRSNAGLAGLAAASLVMSLTASACSGGDSEGESAAGDGDASVESADDHGDEDDHDHDHDETDSTDREHFDEGDEPIGDDYHESLDALRAEAPPAEVVDRVACDLISAADVEELGYSVTAGPIVAEGSSGDECTFTVANRYGSRAPVLVVVYSADDADALGPDVLAGSEPLADVGVEAWTVSSLQLAQARLADGRVVSVQDVAAEAPQESLIRLLEQAAERA